MNTSTTQRIDKQAGFTLVEILVTTAIIGILIGIVLGISGMSSKKSDEGKTRAEMQKISNSIEQYRIVYGTVPLLLADLTNVNTKIDNEFKQIKLIDPWGQPFVYTNFNRYSYRLFSLGASKALGDDNIESGSF